ncbi:CGNR zinc finger domain-containing protein [Saccharothrix luteola]|uniref:CGNR zinc finger domain-containing protein n=1 Tax=Saccharothrix luteola TaxID=2893018 RepID=UPI001E5A6D38|nr:ABATE domain-containing protein [Saccharothrix luteola]MCC8249308.1 ABATE domain-containing protein [Saccharothrix luteola]
MEHAFPCGDLALDFAGTLRARRSPVPCEVLGTPRALDAWFVESGVADTAPGAAVADLAAAVALRESIYVLVRGRIVGERDEPASVDLLNRVAAHPPVVPRLGPAGRVLTATVEQALSSVARHAIGILGGPAADLLKECGRPECTQVYVDSSRGFRREWCAMATCGNKMKALAHRARLRGNPPLRPSRLAAG